MRVVRRHGEGHGQSGHQADAGGTSQREQGGAAAVVSVPLPALLSKRDCVLTNGTDVEVHVVGTGLYMPDTSDPSVGVWLEAPDGTVCATARVTESTSTTLVCVFDEVAQEEGSYKLCVASRDGMDPEQYGVTIARRNVTVVNAAEEEGTENG